MATNVSMGKFAPKGTGIRDPRNASKKNGMFFNWPRYQYFGGAQQPHNQNGSKMPYMKAENGQNATGPISDRGRGR